MTQDREQKPAKNQETEATEEIAATQEQAATDLDALDDLLDEIDSVLEENAEEFVRNYIQKGGQ